MTGSKGEIMAFTAVPDKSFYDQLPRASPTDDRPGKRPNDADFAEHLRTYRGFVKGVMLFAGHVLLVLILLYYFLM
jgi:hypothetical protein